MEAAASLISTAAAIPVFRLTNNNNNNCHLLSIVKSRITNRSNNLIPSSSRANIRLRAGSRRLIMSAVSDLTTASDPAGQIEVTWQILVGTLAGVIPFIVAGIEFTKRIVAQKKCGVCQGSGLVLTDNKCYIRCSTCGGLLPWQSWKRFFSG